jgi:hypothetical protein
MSGFKTGTDQYTHLSRSNLWSTQLKDVLESKLMGFNWIKMVSEFTDGDTLNIPSIGSMVATDYEEGNQVPYSAFNTGNFTFTITEYKAIGTYIYNKFKQDSFYMNEVQSSFVPKMSRAIAVAMETDMLRACAPSTLGGFTGGQTATDYNVLNGARHRWVGSGSSETISIDDIRQAAYALERGNVPLTNLVGIIDPSVAYALGSQPNLLNFSNNPQWEGVITSGVSDGMKFFKNIWGFDLYVSQHLHVNNASEAIDGRTAAAGVNNMFFSAAGDVLPIIGQVRQAPKVDSSYNKDYQRDEFVTTARWGVKMFRPENMVMVVTDTDQVYA